MPVFYGALQDASAAVGETLNMRAGRRRIGVGANPCFEQSSEYLCLHCLSRGAYVD